MNKQTKMLLGLGVVGVAAYFIWKSQQPKANQIGGPKKVKIPAIDTASCAYQCRNESKKRSLYQIIIGTESNYDACVGSCIDDQMY